jgi:hypothetical protein
MKIFLSYPAKRSSDARLCDFITPARWTHEPATQLYAADNGAFGSFDEKRFVAMARTLAAQPIKPVFVTLPDVVCDHAATLQLFGRWHRILAGGGLNRAFVLQNGVESGGWRAVPWDYIEAVFIGGDTAFKFSEHTAYLVRMAKLMGKWVHMGRVNSVRRLAYAEHIGCDSIDGSGIAKFSDDKLPRMFEHLDRGQRLLL